MNFPEDEALPNNYDVLPHVIIGDKAFRLTNNMLKPYLRNQAQHDEKKTILIIDFAEQEEYQKIHFGLLSKIFRIFCTAIEVKTDTIDNKILASCYLHKFLINTKISSGINHEDQEIENNLNFKSLQNCEGNSTTEAFEIREKFKEYFQIMWVAFHDKMNKYIGQT